MDNHTGSVHEIASQLKIFHKIARTVYSSFDLEKIFTQITDSAVYTLGYTTALVLIYDRNQKSVRAQALSTKRKYLPQINKIMGFSLKDFSATINPDINETLKKVFGGEMAVAPSLEEIAYPVLSKKVCSLVQKLAKTKNYILIPLDIERELAGAIFISSAKERISEDEMEMLESFRYIASHVLSNASLLNKSKAAEESLKTEKAYLNQLLENSPEAVVTTDMSGNVIRINSEFTRIFGYESEEALGRCIDDLVAPKDLYKSASSITRLVGRGEKFSLETRRRCKDGTMIDVSLLGSPIEVEGEQVGSYAIYRDISQRKKAEQEIKNSLREKEVLLKEIHHRVKNNMQIISSLIHLQSAKIEDEGAAEILKSSQDRIKSMAIIHEKLYQSENFTKIDLFKYVQSLTDHLFTSYGTDKKKIRFHIDIKDICLDINQAIPCGLIINELLSNCLKHAFPDGGEGKVNISVRRLGETSTELVVYDNGVGIPADMDIERTDSLGLTLVKLLSEEQLKGSVDLDRTQGTCFRIVF